MKVAKLVYVSLVTRVIVDENATDEQILEKSKNSLIEKVRNELGENLEEIVNDTEVPFEDGKQCLNCGFVLTYAKTHTDALGKHAECPECGSTSDVEDASELIKEVNKSEVIEALKKKFPSNNASSWGSKSKKLLIEWYKEHILNDMNAKIKIKP